MQAEQILRDLGLDPEEAVQIDNRLSSRSQRNPFICLCGHPEARHSVIGEGTTFCKPSRHECHCEGIQRVLSVSDTRVFVRKSNGYGKDHALTRGIAAAVKKKIDVEWVDELSCSYCHVPREDSLLTPLMAEIDRSVDRLRVVRDRNLRSPSGFAIEACDFLLCPTCLEAAVLKSGG